LVAYLILQYSDAGYKVSTDTIVGAILHDIVEDTEFSLEMVELAFSKEVAEIVYGLTRVRPDGKLTAPELLDDAFYKKLNILKEEKVKPQTSLALFLISFGMPVCFYLTYIHYGNLLKTNFGYSSAEVISHNLMVGLVCMTGSAIQLALTYKFNPLKIVKIRFFIFVVFALFFPILFNAIKTPFHLFLFQCCIIVFALDNYPAKSIFFKHFPVLKRFTYTCVLHAVSHACIYIIISFGLIYLVKWFGQMGVLFLLVPVCLGFGLSLRYFEKLERESENLHPVLDS
jgi:hypothetical protein